MRIFLTRISNDSHRLEIARDDGSRERVELPTREFLFHDLLHYAVESAIDSREGFWGALAAGKNLAEINDRSGASMKDYVGAMAEVEFAVGVLTGAIKRAATPEDVTEMLRNIRASGQAVPDWLTADRVADVKERMRRLLGRWNATAFGRTMALEWPASAPAR